MPASKRSSAKRRKSSKLKALPLPDGLRIGSGEKVVIEEDAYPDATDVLVFSPADGSRIQIPEHAETFLSFQLHTIVDDLLESLFTPNNQILIIVKMPKANGKRLQQFLLSKIVVPNSDFRFTGSRTPFKMFCQHLHLSRPAADAIFSDSDEFTMPDSSADESDSATPVQLVQRKAPAKQQPTVPSTPNPLQGLRCPANSRIVNGRTVEFQDILGLRETLETARPLSPIATEPPSRAAQSLPSCSSPEVDEERSCRSASPVQPMDESAAAPKVPQARRRVRFRAVDFSVLKVNVPEPTGSFTVLFRPATEGGNLQKVSPWTIAKELEPLGKYSAVRDIRDGGLAIDFPEGTAAEPLLALITLGGLDVTCRLPVSSSTCAGILSGVHPLLTPEEIINDIQTIPSVKVTAVRRLAKPGQESWSVKLSFSGTSVPERALLFGRSRAIKPYVEKPLRCYKCSRWGHAARVCRSKQRCSTCGEDHQSTDCPTPDKPCCANCGLSHPADSTACQARAFQAKVCEVAAIKQLPHREARRAVTIAAKTYAAAAKTTRPPRAPAQPAGPNFIHNVAHPRPPVTPGQTDYASLKILFSGLMTILTAAAASGDFAGALSSVASLFASQAPGADPGMFAV